MLISDSFNWRLVAPPASKYVDLGVVKAQFDANDTVIVRDRQDAVLMTSSELLKIADELRAYHAAHPDFFKPDASQASNQPPVSPSAAGSEGKTS